MYLMMAFLRIAHAPPPRAGLELAHFRVRAPPCRLAYAARHAEAPELPPHIGARIILPFTPRAISRLII